jgi:hypothetical protein
VTDLVAEATAELYAAELSEFTARRQRLVASARTAGDKEAARRIGELRKPTKAAWLLNRLVRTQPEIPAQLATVADGLREASRAGDGARLRELSGARSALVGEFTSRALSSVADPPAGLREDIAGTFDAAIADPAVAADLAAGTLIRPVRWAGFGAGLEGGFGSGAPGASGSRVSGAGASGASGAGASGASGAGGSGPDGSSASASRAGLSLAPPLASASAASAPASSTSSATAASPTSIAAGVTGSAAATGESAEPEAVSLRVTAERNRRLQQLRDAERAVVNAATLAESAEENESRLEDLVRDLEQRLVVAREELSAARLRSRQAEAAERKARHTLDRLRPPEEGHR